jgi:hypothetical protein
MLYDRVSFTTGTTGTGTITVGAASIGFRTPAAAAVPDGTLVEYAIEDGADWETGTGIYSSGAATLTRVLSQSSTGSLLVLGGTAKCFFTPIASRYNALATSAPVVTRVRRATNQSIANGASYVDLVWDTASYEVGGDFWASGANVTVPETGYYQIFVEATFDGAGLIGTITANLQIILNGATVVGEDEKQVFVNNPASLYCMAQRQFTAGDVIKAQVKHSNATAVAVLAQGDHSPDIILCKVGGAKGDASPYNYGLTAAIGAGQFLN